MMASSKKGVCKDDESTCMGENWVPSSGAYWMVEAEEARRMTDESGKSGRGCGHSVDSQQKRHWLKGTPSKSFKEGPTLSAARSREDAPEAKACGTVVIPSPRVNLG